MLSAVCMRKAIEKKIKKEQGRAGKKIKRINKDI